MIHGGESDVRLQTASYTPRLTNLLLVSDKFLLDLSARSLPVLTPVHCSTLLTQSCFSFLHPFLNQVFGTLMFFAAPKEPMS